jgi:hypothetical protein
MIPALPIPARSQEMLASSDDWNKQALWLRATADFAEKAHQEGKPAEVRQLAETGELRLEQLLARSRNLRLLASERCESPVGSKTEDATCSAASDGTLAASSEVSSWVSPDDSSPDVSDVSDACEHRNRKGTWDEREQGGHTSPPARTDSEEHIALALSWLEELWAQRRGAELKSALEVQSWTVRRRFNSFRKASRRQVRETFDGSHAASADANPAVECKRVLGTVFVGSDRGSGSRDNLEYYEAREEGWLMLGHGVGIDMVLVREGPLVRRATSWKRCWYDIGSGKERYYAIYIPACADPDFVPCGVVFRFGAKMEDALEPEFSYPVGLVHKSLVTPASPQIHVWSDEGTNSVFSVRLKLLARMGTAWPTSASLLERSPEAFEIRHVSDAPKLVAAKLRLRNTFLDVEEDASFSDDVQPSRVRAASEPRSSFSEDGRPTRNVSSSVFGLPSTLLASKSLFANEQADRCQTDRMRHINEIRALQDKTEWTMRHWPSGIEQACQSQAD